MRVACAHLVCSGFAPCTKHPLPEVRRRVWHNADCTPASDMQVSVLPWSSATGSRGQAIHRRGSAVQRATYCCMQEFGSEFHVHFTSITDTIQYFQYLLYLMATNNERQTTKQHVDIGSTLVPHRLVSWQLIALATPTHTDAIARARKLSPVVTDTGWAGRCAIVVMNRCSAVPLLALQALPDFRQC